jgi:hypothetical protein
MSESILDHCVDAISVLSTLRFPPADLEATAKGWAGICTRHGFTGAELAQATVTLYETMREFPAPVDLINAVEEVRAKAKISAFARVVPCVDRDGRPLLAPPEMIRDGVYIGDEQALLAVGGGA